MDNKKITFHTNIKKTATQQPIETTWCVFASDYNSVQVEFVVADLRPDEIRTVNPTIVLIMEDGSTVQRTKEQIVQKNNVFSYKLKDREGQHIGAVKAQLKLTTVTGEIYMSNIYTFTILESLDSVPVPKEFVIDDIQNILQEVKHHITHVFQDEIERERVFKEYVSNIQLSEKQRETWFNQSQQTRANLFQVFMDEAGEVLKDAQQVKDLFDELTETGIIETNIREKLEELETSYAPRLSTLEQNDVSLTAQLQQTEQELNAQLEQNTKLLDDALDGDITAVLNNAIVQTEIENKLSAKETEYAPRLTTAEKELDIYQNAIVDEDKTVTSFAELTDTNWVEASSESIAYYGSKNFLIPHDQEATTTNGITLTIKDGVFTINGTATSNTYIVFNIDVFKSIPSASYNAKVWKDSGSISQGFSFYMSATSNPGHSRYPIKLPVYNTPNVDGFSDTQTISSSTEIECNYGVLYLANGTVANSLVIRPMLTLSERFGAGDYELSSLPTQFTGTVDISEMEYTCLQSSSNITITEKTISYRDVQRQAELVPSIKNVVYSGFDTATASGTIITIDDGVEFSEIVDIYINNEPTGNVKVIGKNLINYKMLHDIGLLENDNLHYEPITLKPNTVYTYIDDSTEKILNGFLSIRYGGTTDATSTPLTNIIDSNLGHRNSFTFVTPDYQGQYYLRFYGSTCINMLDRTGYDTMMLIEGDSVIDDREPYNETTYDISEETPLLPNSDVAYLFTDTLSSIECTYYKRTSETDNEGLPNYWKQYLSGKQFNLRKELATTSMHGLVFSFFTDVHIEENTGNSAFLLDYLRDEIGIPFKVFGGDILNYATDSDAKGVAQYYKFREKYVDEDTFLTPGNHDFYHNLGSNIFYNTLVKPLEMRYNTNGYNDTKHTYYYIDVASQKTRLVFFDSNDWDKEYAEHYDWLVGVFNSIPENWNCILFSHILHESTYFGGDLPFLGEQYNNRTSGTRVLGDPDAGSIQYDFSNGKGQVVCMIGGHNHEDWSSTRFGFPVILTTTDCLGGKLVSHDTVEMTAGTTTENAFDVFFIDYGKRTIKSIRIGAGEDRNWTF